MTQAGTTHSINIRPAVSVYATYRRLSYTPWHGVAEFVDNSTQSYYDHRVELIEVYKEEGDPGHLKVEISHDSERNSLTITDNANGMDMEELTRAVVLDRPPPDPSGRCEYGMGLKTAACWFGTTWTIRTTKRGSSTELVARVHIPDLVENQAEDIAVELRPAKPESHFTVVTIEGLYKPIRGRTPGRMREQLGSMYREDLRSGEIEILWNGQHVEFEEFPVLKEVLPDGTETTWKKPVAFQVPWEPTSLSYPVRGWIGLLMPGSQRDAGFALLRRGRVIIGGPHEGYKPQDIFGQGNTFRSQRLVGELHMDDWPVTQAKDAFDWSGGLEDAFIEELQRVSRDYMDKAEGYRQPGRRIAQSDMQLASESTRQVFADRRFGAALAQEMALPDPPKTEILEQSDTAKLRSVSDGPVVYRLSIGTQEWVFRLHWQDQISDAHWMGVSYPDDSIADVFLNTSHPFFEPYLNERKFLELLQKFVLALALAERMARQISSNGLVSPGDFRNFMNRVLRYAAEIEADDGR